MTRKSITYNGKIRVHEKEDIKHNLYITSRTQSLKVFIELNNRDHEFIGLQTTYKIRLVKCNVTKATKQESKDITTKLCDPVVWRADLARCTHFITLQSFSNVVFPTCDSSINSPTPTYRFIIREARKTSWTIIEYILRFHFLLILSICSISNIQVQAETQSKMKYL